MGSLVSSLFLSNILPNNQKYLQINTQNYKRVLCHSSLYNNQMGGHGGLNILPQKKWNVYNRDNRTIVERDQRLDRERRQKQAQENRNRATEKKLSYLREENQQQQQKSNLLVQELEKIQQDKRHVNLFEKEERIIQNKEVTDAKMLEQMEFIKDKSIDMSSKFLGAYSNDKMKPWYLKNKKERQNDQRKKQLFQQEIQSVKKTTSIVTNQVYLKETKRQRSRERSREDRIPIKKQQNLSKIQQMRLQRKLRQEKERKRANDLMKAHNSKR